VIRPKEIEEKGAGKLTEKNETRPIYLGKKS